MCHVRSAITLRDIAAEAHPTGRALPTRMCYPTILGTYMTQRSTSDSTSLATVAEPAVDIRIVLFTVADGTLRLAAVDHSAPLQLPRGFPTPDGSLDADAARIIQRQLGIQERYLEQLYTLNTGEPHEWAVVISYMALVSSDETGEPPTLGAWHDVNDFRADDSIDGRVIDYAILRLRAKLSYTSIAFHLLPQQFTLGELQQTYEAVLQKRLDKRNFRRRIRGANILDQTPAKRRDGSHRPANLYQFRPPHDQEQFLTPTWVEGSPT